MELKNKSLVVFKNGDIIAHITHNKAIDSYAKKYNLSRETVYSCEHVLSMLVLIEHDIAESIMHFGELQHCKAILEEVGIYLK